MPNDLKNEFNPGQAIYPINFASSSFDPPSPHLRDLWHFNHVDVFARPRCATAERRVKSDARAAWRTILRQEEFISLDEKLIIKRGALKRPTGVGAQVNEPEKNATGLFDPATRQVRRTGAGLALDRVSLVAKFAGAATFEF